MGGLYARAKVWDSGEVLTAPDLNAEFENVRTNFVPTMMDDYAANATQYQTQTDPYPSESVSLPTSLAGELERYRYELAEIKGTTYHYENAPTDLTILSQPNLGLHVGLEFEGKYGGASSTTDVLGKIINQGAIINALSWSSADVAAADFDSTAANVKFGTYSYILGAGNVLAFPGWHGNPVKGTVSAWFKNLAAGDYVAYNPLLGLELYLDASGYLTWKATEQTAATETTKNTTTVAGSSSRALNAYHHVAAQWRFNDEGGASTDLMDLDYDGSTEGTPVTGDNIDIGYGKGGVWFFGAKRNDPEWDHFSAMSVKPSAEASNNWTYGGTLAEGTYATISGGVLTIDSSSAAADTAYYHITPHDFDLSSPMTFEWKIKTTAPKNQERSWNSYVRVRDNTFDREMVIAHHLDRVCVYYGHATSATSEFNAEVFLNGSDWHVYRLTTDANGSDLDWVLYVDGVRVLSGTNDLSGAANSDYIEFGDNDVSSTGGVSSWEFFKWSDASASAPLAAGSQGNLDSIGIISNILSANSLARLQNSKVSDVFISDVFYGPTVPMLTMRNRDENYPVSVSTATFGVCTENAWYIASDGASEIVVEYNVAVLNDTSAKQTYLTLSIDDDVSGQSYSDGGHSGNLTSITGNSGAAVIMMAVARRLIARPAGLYKVSPYLASEASSTSSIVETCQGIRIDVNSKKL